jgi:hypothetical protein
MTEVIVDASVALKWLVPESDSARAEAIMTSASTLHAPHFLMLETVNACWKNWRKQMIDRPVVLEASSKLTGLIDVWHRDEVLIEDAASLAVELQHPIFDCIYLALARQLNLQVVTADQRLIAIGTGLAVSFENWRPSIAGAD